MLLGDKPILTTNIAYLSVHNAHNGETIKIPKPLRFHTITSFKTFLLESFTQYVLANIDNAFLLTSFGIKLNFNMINELNDVYVFDKRLFAAEYEKAVLQAYINQNDGNYYLTLKPKQSPIQEEIADKQNKKKLLSILKVNDGWAKAVIQDCYGVDEQIKLFIKQVNTIFKSLNIIFQFVSNFINGIEKNVNNYHNYIKLLNMKTLHKTWPEYYKLLKQFPRIELSNLKSPVNSSDTKISLANFLEPEKLEYSSKFIGENLSHVVAKFNGMSDIINKVNRDKMNVDGKIESLRNESIHSFKDYENLNSKNLHEVANLVNKVSNNVDTVSSNIVEVFEDSKNNLSPKIYDGASRLFKFLQDLYQFKIKLINESLSIFQVIADLQMRMVNVKSDLKYLTTPSEKDVGNTSSSISFETINDIKAAEDYLSLTIDLPLLFGFIIIEKRRQFEWYDFYSKGVVSTLSEQLAIVIDHEKLFQKIWLKKFQHFIKLLNNGVDSRPKFPSIDITLVSGNYKSTSIFNIFDCQIEREDIVRYTKLVRLHDFPSNQKFLELLEKNFKDLIKSTENMQRVTKLVSSLSSYTSPNNSNLESSKLKNSGDVKDESEFDLNLVKGLKTRIKKLENLLHQQQYKNISNWPVIKAQDKQFENTKMSLIMDSNAKNLSASTILNTPVTNPTLLLQRRHTTKPIGSEAYEPIKKLDASTTIDKHLDNIRLKRDNSELNANIDRLAGMNSSNEALIENLRAEIAHLRDNEKRKEDHYEKLLSEKDKEIELLKIKSSENFDQFKLDKNLVIENLQSKLSKKDDRISELQDDFAKFTKLNTESSQEIFKLNEEIKKLRSELNDSYNMKGDLLSNMSSKESEYIKERNNLDSEIKKLNLRNEELTDDYENLMELTQAKHKHNENLINELNSVIVQLFKKIKILIENNFDYVLEFCYVLESMGLLLVKEFDENKKVEEYRITRVKGLKSKKNGNNGDEVANDTSIIGMESKLNSKVLDDLTSCKEWVETIDIDLSDDHAALKSISTTRSEVEDQEDEEETNKTNDQSTRLLEVFNSSFINPNNNFDEFLRVISFKENVHMKTQEMENSIINLKFFLNAISKRFKDVEGFAKKLTKENKSKISEINKLTTRANGKIAINNFHIDDLVLFLPTRIERENVLDNNEDALQPWAAFNIGAPHYFLKIDTNDPPNDREWMVGKILNIEQHKVTYENSSNKEENPFKLSVGITWYMVEALNENK